MSARAKPALIRGSARPDCLAYLYCVLEPDSSAHQQLARREVAGLDPDEPLFPVETADLVAAVSYVPAEVFQEKPLNELVADLARLAPYAVRHEAAISQLAAGAPGLVPMGFGAVYRDRERVAAVLRERSDELHRMLDRVRGRLEWGLKVIVDDPRARDAAIAESVELRRQDEAIAGATPGRAYLLRRQRDRMIQAEAERQIRATIAEIFAKLAAISVDAREDDLSSDQPPVGPLLALKAAFLVAVDQVDQFRGECARFAREQAHRGLSLEVTGPWAPYSFVRSGST